MTRNEADFYLALADNGTNDANTRELLQWCESILAKGVRIVRLDFSYDLRLLYVSTCMLLHFAQTVIGIAT